jgi:uncharacterized membrane protein YedE/YeeE
MRGTFESTLPWWIAGPLIGLVIVALLALANKRFGVVGGVTDLVHGSAEGRGLRSWRTLLVLGMVLGGAAYALLAGAPDAGSAYSWLDTHLSTSGEVGLLFGAGLLIGVGARTAGGCTSGHGLTRLSTRVTGQHRLDDDDHGQRNHDHTAARGGDLR